MLKQKVDLLMVSENDFHKELESSDDIKSKNLKNDVYNNYLEADIVIYEENGMTIILKNRYGGEGSVV